MPSTPTQIPTTSVIRAASGRSTRSFRKSAPSGTITVEDPATLERDPVLAGGPALHPARTLSLAPGTRIDGVFEVLGPLGSGIGEVYAIQDRFTGRALTMKIQSPDEVGRPGSLRRFRAEAAALATVDHPVFPAFAGKGSHAGRDYMLLERVVGTDLKTWLTQQGGRVGEAQALHVLLQIAQGMQRIHGVSGMVHRDLKPAHVMVTDPQALTVKIVDFAVSAFLILGADGAPVPTGGVIDEGNPGRIVGSPGSMSPEQCQGAPPSVGMDIYALGCLFHQLITGRTPFLAATTAEMLKKHQYEPPPEFDPILGIAPGSVYLLARCLAKKPQERFRSYASFVESIRSAQYQYASRQKRIQTTTIIRRA